MSSPNYRIYPSLLDGFQRFLDSEKEFEDVWNVDADGNYKRSLEEIAAEREQNLIDSINRVPREPSQAADKGTCFNALIDYSANSVDIPKGMDWKHLKYKNNYQVYEMSYNGWQFAFNGHDVDFFARKYVGAVPQYLCKAALPTKYGVVLLYGYIDEIVGERVIDIKTTSRYSFGKFEHGWQKEVYPYCLVTSGDHSGVTSFDYDVYVWHSRVGEPDGMERYTETYDYNHEATTKRLTAFVERFIEWLEGKRDVITDTKIFGL